MLDFNTVYGVIIAIVLIVLIRFILPYLKERGINTEIYGDIKMGLLLFGYAFRDEKVKKITDLLFGIVSNIETLDVASQEKKEFAMRAAFDSLLSDFDIVLDEGAMNLIIDIAVTYLPPTNLME